MSKPLTCAECGAPVDLEVMVIKVYRNLTEDCLGVEGGEVEDTLIFTTVDRDERVTCSAHPHHSTGYLEYDPKTLEYRITKEASP